MHLLKEYDDLFKYLVEIEFARVEKTKIDASTDFELARKYYENEGVKEGLRRFMQKLNQWASSDI